MSDEADFWSATQQAFAPLQLPRPEMSAKVLKRPPFRFIFDVVSSINEVHHTFDGMFPAEFLDAAHMDSKEKKVEYLTLLTQHVQKILGRTIDVNPKKIVSGSEVEKTNNFLRGVAEAVQRRKQMPAPPPPPAPLPVPTLAPPVPPPVPPPPPPPPPAPPVMQMELLNQSERSQLPKMADEYLSSSPSHALARKSAEEMAQHFTKKIEGFSLGLDATEERSITVEAQSIVHMWQELEQDAVPTSDSKLPADALEKAIARQLETLQQLQALQDENDVLVEKLETLVV